MSDCSEEILDNLYNHVLNGEAAPVAELTREALDQGVQPLEILFAALIPGLEEVGRLFEEGTYFVPEMLVAAKAMKAAMVILQPLIAETGTKPIGKFVIGTVKGDIHDIGKDLCKVMLEGAGFQVIDLGVNVAPEKFAEAIRLNQPVAVGMSAFLTTTMPMLKANLDYFAQENLRDKTIFYVGGAPVTQEHSAKVGSDAYAQNASALVRDLKARLGLVV